MGVLRQGTKCQDPLLWKGLVSMQKHDFPLGQFHTVTLLRSLTQGSLIVGSLAPVNGTSQVINFFFSGHTRD